MKKVVLACSSFAVLLLVGVLLLRSGCRRGLPLVRVSARSFGGQADSDSGSPSISADGRFVAFCSDAGNLVPNDTNSRRDIFVYDSQTGLLERVSVSSTGDEADGGSLLPSISADGRFVAFASSATNLAPGDGNGHTDIFVHDRETGKTESVSVGSSGVGPDHCCMFPSITADGRLVAFRYGAMALGGPADIVVHDRETGFKERVVVGSAEGEGNFSDVAPSISADGRFVTFASFAANLVPGDTNGQKDIFVHDRESGKTERVSVSSSGTEADYHCAMSCITADGQLVAFASCAKNLVPADTMCRDVFVHDRGSGLTTRVSVDSTGKMADASSGEPSLSADGRFVAFVSEASNLVPGNAAPRGGLFVHDRTTGRVRCLTTNLYERMLECRVLACADSPAISADGRFVAFACFTENEKWDVFVARNPLAP